MEDHSIVWSAAAAVIAAFGGAGSSSLPSLRGSARYGRAGVGGGPRNRSGVKR